MQEMERLADPSHYANDPDSAGSQFFICVADNSGLDRRYTVFGEVFRGIDVIDRIEKR